MALRATLRTVLWGSGIEAGVCALFTQGRNLPGPVRQHRGPDFPIRIRKRGPGLSLGTRGRAFEDQGFQPN